MAEANTAEAEAKADAAFNAAFVEISPNVPEKVAEEPKVQPISADPTPIPPPAAVEKPQYTRVTKQDWDNTKAAAGKVANLESQVAKLVGSAPTAERLVEQVLERIQGQPAGLNVEISDEDFAELAADFPELAKHNITALQRVFKKVNMKGTGPVAAQVPSPMSPAQPVDVSSVADQVRMRLEEDALKRTYPDWSEIVGRPPNPDAKVPDDNPFRAWLAKQSAEYQKAVNETDSPADVQEAISHFKASLRAAPLAAPIDKAAARRAVIEDAVTPRGEGNPPPLNAPSTAEEEFAKAFNRTKAH